MSRRRRIKKLEITPDAKYGDLVVAKFINHMMLGGKKTTSERIVYQAFDRICDMMKEKDPVKLFHDALETIKPAVEVKSRRVGGATYQVPVEVRPDRANALSMRWLIAFSRKRSETTMVERLAKEIVDALNGRGGSVKKREDTHKMAEANKAFSHYRW